MGMISKQVVTHSPCQIGIHFWIRAWLVSLSTLKTLYFLCVDAKHLH